MAAGLKRGQRVRFIRRLRVGLRLGPQDVFTVVRSDALGVWFKDRYGFVSRMKSRWLERVGKSRA